MPLLSRKALYSKKYISEIQKIQQSNKLTFHRRFFAFLLPWLRRCCLHATFATYFFSSGKIMAVRYGDGGRGCVCWHPLICLETKTLVQNM